MNSLLITSIIAIFFTQFVKYPIALLISKRKVPFSIVFTTGGMPSSHSAAVSSLITSLVLEYGFNSPLVAIATIFGVIIMFDSMGVRRQSGEQGLLLNLIAHHLKQQQHFRDELFQLLVRYDIDTYDEMIIDKYLGHKPTEVIIGTFIGVFVAFVCRMVILNVFI